MISIKYFIDTEFIEDGKTIDLLSIGIVAEDGREFYAENQDCDRTRAGAWVKANVLPHLDMTDGPVVMGKVDLAAEVRLFCDPDRYGKPEFWGYYADYDWVALCQLYGRMIDLPKGWPMFAMDLKQLAVSLGDPRLPAEGNDEHHALADAQWNKRAWEFLNSLKGHKPG